MNDTTHRPEAARRLTGCPWPTGIHRFVLGVCSRCGTDDLNPQVNRGGFTDVDDQPIPYVPTDAADQADAMVVTFNPDCLNSEHQASNCGGTGPFCWNRHTSVDPNREARVVCQVAVEYIVNHGADGFDSDTMRTVLDQAVAVGVADLYVSMLQDLVDSL